jgi:aspartate/methionine/tyrosine aminotransferase
LDELKAVLAWCREREAILCADECYVDTYYGDARPPSVLEAAGEDREGVVIFFSCSKRSGMTGYRTGFVTGDVRLLSAYASLRNSVGTATPDFVQHAAAAAWSDDRHAAQRRAVFTAKRAIFDRLFRDLGIEIEGSQAAFYLWVKVPGGLTADAYCKHLIEAGIVVTPGASFGPSGEGFVRLALVPTVDECGRAAAAWRKLESEK